jgi:hypothetical protein
LSKPTSQSAAIPAEENRAAVWHAQAVLQRGTIVRGRVMDESDRPIKDARVWAGRAHYSGSQETKTDANGAFPIPQRN